MARIREARNVGAVLAADTALGGLLARQRESQARWQVALARLPPELAHAAGPGPLDAEGWTILAHHASAAAKLRHLKPRIEAELALSGLADRPLRIRLRSPRGT